MCDKYVSCDECYNHRKKIYERNSEQDITLTELKTEVGMFKKLMYYILGTLVSGFIATIFTVVSIG